MKHFTFTSRAPRFTLSGLILSSLLFAQDAPLRPKILGVSHIAIYAHDYEKSRNFYGGFFGLGEPYSLKNPDGSASMTFYKINERQYIELFPEHDAGSDRLNHISFETDDIEGLRRYLASKGVKVPDKPSRARIGNLSFNITDPAGNKLEMVQYMPEGKTVQAQGKFLGDDRVSKRMIHAGIIVTQLDPEYQFYKDVLGFTETWRGSKSGDVLSWVNMKVPDGNDYVEFMLYKEAPEPTKRGSAHHLCLEVPDVAASVAGLKAKPAYAQYGKPIDIREGVNRKRQANIFDPDGTRTELMEPNTVDGKPAPSSTAPPPN